MNRILQLLYNLFYTYFVQMMPPKGRDPAEGAMTMLIMSGLGISMSILWYSGLHSAIINSLPKAVGSDKFYQLLWSIIISTFNWLVLRYILFIRLKISKIDGKSPYFEYMPTKKDKIFGWIFCTVSTFSPVILRTSELLLFDR